MAWQAKLLLYCMSGCFKVHTEAQGLASADNRMLGGTAKLRVYGCQLKWLKWLESAALVLLQCSCVPVAGLLLHVLRPAGLHQSLTIL